MIETDKVKQGQKLTVVRVVVFILAVLCNSEGVLKNLNAKVSF
jgi:hypothetical protein